MQIQISWQKPTDLDLQCLQRQGISGFSRTRVKYDYSTKLIPQKSSLLHSYVELLSGNKIYPKGLQIYICLMRLIHFSGNSLYCYLYSTEPECMFNKKKTIKIFINQSILSRSLQIFVLILCMVSVCNNDK